MRKFDTQEILCRVAAHYNCTPEHVRAEIEKVIEACWNHSDPEIHAKWAAMSAAGGRPNLEEVILAIAAEAVHRGEGERRQPQRPSAHTGEL